MLRSMLSNDSQINRYDVDMNNNKKLVFDAEEMASSDDETFNDDEIDGIEYQTEQELHQKLKLDKQKEKPIIKKQTQKIKTNPVPVQKKQEEIKQEEKPTTTNFNLDEIDSFFDNRTKKSINYEEIKQKLATVTDENKRTIYAEIAKNLKKSRSAKAKVAYDYFINNK